MRFFVFTETLDAAFVVAAPRLMPLLWRLSDGIALWTCSSSRGYIADEEEEPELYSYWQGRVTALEEVVDEITP